MWVPREEKDPVLWHYPGRKSVGYYGAVRLRDGQGLFRREPAMFDGVTFWEFLRKLERISQVAGRTVIVIIDNAKYHHAKLHADLAGGAAGALCAGLPAPIQPGTQPD
jgi:hypothetical protein